MKILKIGSQVKQVDFRVRSYTKSKVMVIGVDYKSLYPNQNVGEFSYITAYRTSGRGQAYNDLFWL